VNYKRKKRGPFHETPCLARSIQTVMASEMLTVTEYREHHQTLLPVWKLILQHAGK